MKRTSAIFFFLCISLIVKADFINLVQADECETIVEVFVSGELIRVSMEIGEQDYQWFSDVIPDSLLDAGYSNEDKASKMGAFSAKSIHSTCGPAASWRKCQPC
jgi:hypothetical protein